MLASSERDDDLSRRDLQVKSLFNMVSHEDVCSSEDRLNTAIRSAILVQCLKFTGYLSPPLSEEADVEAKFIQLFYHLQFAIKHNVLLIYR